MSHYDVIQVDRIKSDHDATIAFFPIPYDLQTNYKRDVWLYKHGFIYIYSGYTLHSFHQCHLVMINGYSSQIGQFQN
jgi:hypothetical protein